MIHATTTMRIDPDSMNIIDVEISKDAVNMFLLTEDMFWDTDVDIISYPVDKPIIECVKFSPVQNMDDAITETLWAYNTEWFYSE